MTKINDAIEITIEQAKEMVRLIEEVGDDPEDDIDMDIGEKAGLLCLLKDIIKTCEALQAREQRGNDE